MRIKVARLGGGPRKFSDFADENGFELEVNERKRVGVGPCGPLRRYYVSFARVEIMDRGGLISSSGNGDTIAEAIADYAEQLRGQRLAHNAWQPSRREVQAPNEWISEDFSEFLP